MPDDIEDLREYAARFRALARVVNDERNRRQLLNMAAQLETQADKLEEAVRGEDQPDRTSSS